MVARRQYAVHPLWPRMAPAWVQFGNFGQYADWQAALSLGPTVMPSVLRTVFTMVFLTLGYQGALAHWRMDRRTWIGVAALFVGGSLGVIAYLNLPAGPSIGYGILPANVVREARERDYFFVFAFLAWGIWLFKKVRSDLSEAKRLAGELLAMARELAEPAFELQAQQSIAVTSLCLGEFAAAADAMRQAEAIYDPARFDKNTQRFGQDPCVACLAFGSIALHLMGDADGSARAAERSLELARQLGQPSSMALALHFSAMLHQLRGDAPGAEREARRAMELAEWEEFSFWHAGGRILCAWAAAMQGRDPEDSTAELRAGIDAWLATGSRTYHTYFLGLLADALLHHGRNAEALEVLEGAIDLVPVLHEGLHHPELHRLTAACLARSRRADAVESALEELDVAADVARRQGADWVLRQVERQREALTRRAKTARGRRR